MRSKLEKKLLEGKKTNKERTEKRKIIEKKTEKLSRIFSSRQGKVDCPDFTEEAYCCC